MNKFLLIGCILSINNCIAQTITLTPEYLEKNATVITNRQLNVGDFQGVPDLNSPEIAETRSSIYPQVVKIKIFVQSRKLIYKVSPYFLKSSWIKDEAKRYPDTSFLCSILRHEQDHYDLTILGAIEIQRALNAYPANNIDNNSKANIEIKEIYDTNYNIFRKISDCYETDVDHGRDDKKQMIWNRMINDAMAAKSWKGLLKYMDDNLANPRF